MRGCHGAFRDLFAPAASISISIRDVRRTISSRSGSVVVEAMDEPETRTQGRREQPGARGAPIKEKAAGARTEQPWAAVDDDVEIEVFHRW
jgi:hypothetical protein